MAVRMSKPWLPLDAEHVAMLTGHLGVFQLADAQGSIVYIGVAGGRSRFGLKGELQAVLASPPHGAVAYRVEVNQMYRSRHIELLQAFAHDNGTLPPGNSSIDMASLGRIRPYG